MALPAVQSLEDCATYASAIEPLLVPQLLELPTKLLSAISSPDSLLKLYIETNPFVSGLAFSIFLGLVFLIVSEINKNYSQVDRMWSILPTFYNLHYCVWARLVGLPTQRVDAVALYSVVWSIRLTWNYWRKGGYNIGSEDYRWEVIRKNTHPALFFILNVTFISFIQSVLLFLLTSPTYTILLASRIEPSISQADIAFTAVELGLVLSEYISDGQQWDYQGAKKVYQKTAKVPRGLAQMDLDRGFITSGLWAYSRHPNFAAEQLIWFMLYQWSCYAGKVLYSWTGLAALSLACLFQGSTWITELISSGKYPEYAEYQRQVGTFLPASIFPYKTPVAPEPKVIRTSELVKKHEQKTKQKAKQK